MTDIPQPRRPRDEEPEPPSEEECWNEFWDAMADAIAEARIRQARQRTDA